ncbi:MAG: hypothetical protein WCE30_04095 [Mycobacterium sp.]
MTTSPAEGVGDDIVRPETDDYDLLTFGEVAARLSEELDAESKALQRIRGQAAVEPDTIRRLEERIELLKSSGERYRHEATTNESFAKRFGSALDQPSGPRPTWS